MSTSISGKVKQIEGRIARIKRDLDQLGPMRPGSISRQYRNPQERKTPFYLESAVGKRMRGASESGSDVLIRVQQSLEFA
jgi:hypothetical protein